MSIVIFDAVFNLIENYGKAAEKLGINPIFILRQSCQIETNYTVVYMDINIEYDQVKKYIIDNVSDVEALVSLDDRSVITVNRLAQELGIYLNDESAIISNRDKSVMKSLWNQVGILTSKSKVLKSFNDVDIAPLSYPLVIKPSMGFASSGVVKISADNELKSYLRLLDVANSMYYDKVQTREKSILVEEFIDGDEYAVDSLWKNGKAVAHFISSKDNPQGPLFKDHMYIVDPNIEEDVKRKLIETATKVGELSNYRTGATHIEMRINNRGCFVIESACRPGGGGELYKIYSEAYNVDVFEMFLSMFTKKRGLKYLEIRPQRLSMLYIVQQKNAGVIKEIKGLDTILNKPEVFDYVSFKSAGERLMREDINPEYIFFIFTSFSDIKMNKKDAIKEVKKYDDAIEVVCV